MGSCGRVPAPLSVGGLLLLRSFARLVSYTKFVGALLPDGSSTRRLTRVHGRSSNTFESIPFCFIAIMSSCCEDWFIPYIGKDCNQVVAIGKVGWDFQSYSSILIRKSLVIKTNLITCSHPRSSNWSDDGSTAFNVHEGAFSSARIQLVRKCIFYVSL